MISLPKWLRSRRDLISGQVDDDQMGRQTLGA